MSGENIKVRLTNINLSVEIIRPWLITGGMYIEKVIWNDRVVGKNEGNLNKCEYFIQVWTPDYDDPRPLLQEYRELLFNLNPIPIIPITQSTQSTQVIHSTSTSSDDKSSKSYIDVANVTCNHMRPWLLLNNVYIDEVRQKSSLLSDSKQPIIAKQVGHLMGCEHLIKVWQIIESDNDINPLSLLYEYNTLIASRSLLEQISIVNFNKRSVIGPTCHISINKNHLLVCPIQTKDTSDDNNLSEHKLFVATPKRNSLLKYIMRKRLEENNNNNENQAILPVRSKSTSEIDSEFISTSIQSKLITNSNVNVDKKNKDASNLNLNLNSNSNKIINSNLNLNNDTNVAHQQTYPPLLRSILKKKPTSSTKNQNSNQNIINHVRSKSVTRKQKIKT